jgi:hypothetical protein
VVSFSRCLRLGRRAKKRAWQLLECVMLPLLSAERGPNKS